MQLPETLSPDVRHGADYEKTSRAVLLAAAALFLAGAGLLGISFTQLASFEYLRGWADSRAIDGSVGFFTRQFYEDRLFRVRVLSVPMLGLSILLVFLRRRLAGVISRTRPALSETAAFVRSLAERVAGIDRVWLAVGLSALLIGALVRLHFLSEPMRYDEAYTWLKYSSQSPLVVLTYYDVPNNHILNSLLMMVSTWIFGSAEWAIRLPAFVAGILLIPSVFLLVLGLTGGGAAASFAAVLTASSSYLIEYSINARGYTLVCLFTCILLLAAREMCSGRWRMAGPMLFVAAGTAGLATIPIMVYPLATASVWVLLGADLKRERGGYSVLKPLLVSLALTAVLALAWYTPVLAVSGTGAFLKYGVQRSDILGWLADMADFARELIQLFHRDLPLPLTVVLATLFLVGCYRLPALATALFIPFVLMLIQGVVPIEHLRIFTYFLIIYLVIAATGFEMVIRRLVSPAGVRAARVAAIGAVVAWLAAGTWLSTVRWSPVQTKQTGVFPEAKWVIGEIKTRLTDGDVVLSGYPAERPLLYYGMREGISGRIFLQPGAAVEGEYRGIWLVVDRAAEWASLQDMMEVHDLEQRRYRQLRLVAERGNAKIYYLTRDEYGASKVDRPAEHRD